MCFSYLPGVKIMDVLFLALHVVTGYVAKYEVWLCSVAGCLQHQAAGTLQHIVHALWMVNMNEVWMPAKR